MGDLVGLAVVRLAVVGLAVVGDAVVGNFMGVDVLGFAVGFTISPETRLGLELGFRIGVFVGGLGSPLMHAPLVCPPNAPLQHNN